MVDQLKMALLQVQDTLGVAEADLTGADLFETEEPVSISTENGKTELNTVGEGWINDGSVQGAHVQTVGWKRYLGVDGAADMGQTQIALEACCLSDSAVSDVHTFTPAAYVASDYTMWAYSGSQQASSSLRQTISNLVFAPKFTFEMGKPVLLEASGKGVYGGAPTDATQPSATHVRQIYPALLGGTVTINGYGSYGLISGEFDPGFTFEMLKNSEASYGYGAQKMTGQKATFKMTVYKLTVATDDPHADRLAHTPQTLSLAWGSQPQSFTLASGASKALIEDIEDGSDSGIETYTLSGRILDNDWSLVVNNAAA